MSHSISTEQARIDVFRLAFFQDGWWDIYLGCAFILLSVYPATRDLLGPAGNALLVVGLLLLLLLPFYVARTYVTVPRLGLVRLGRQHRATMTSLTLLTAAILAVSLILMVLLATREIIVPPLVFTAIIVGVFSAMARVLGTRRLYLYGCLIAVGNLAGAALSDGAGNNVEWPLALAGAVILLVGLALLVRFLRDYPLPSQEA